MSNKKIEAWKIQVAKDKTIFVASNVKSIHPVFDSIVSNLIKIDLINYVRVTKEDLFFFASSKTPLLIITLLIYVLPICYDITLRATQQFADASYSAST